jgi:hypothetical protein
MVYSVYAIIRLGSIAANRLANKAWQPTKEADEWLVRLGGWETEREARMDARKWREYLKDAVDVSVE